MSEFVTAREIIENALTDTYDDGGILYEKAERWLFRVWLELTRDIFRDTRIVRLPVSMDTHQVRLPGDYRGFVSIGYNDECGRFVPFAYDRNLAQKIYDEDKVNVCKTCRSQDLCEMIGVEEDVENVEVNGTVYQKKTTKILQKSGDYVVFIDEPVSIYEDGAFDRVEMQRRKETKCHLSVAPCGCIEINQDNLSMLSECGCQGAFDCCRIFDYTYPIQPGAIAYYNIFEEAKYIQLDRHCGITHVLLKYRGNAIQNNGNYVFPIDAMEALISGVYYRSIEKKRNVTPYEKERALKAWNAERKKILKDKMRLSMERLLNLLIVAPRIPST